MVAVNKIGVVDTQGRLVLDLGPEFVGRSASVLVTMDFSLEPALDNAEQSLEQLSPADRAKMIESLCGSWEGAMPEVEDRRGKIISP